MKTVQTLFLAAALSVGLLAAAGASANLVGSVDGQTVYDADLNVTWLTDANYAKTSGYSADGKMNFSQAQGWIASLNTSNYLGYNDWRLPTTTDSGAPGIQCSNNGTDCGFNSTGSEMSHLYYTELGNKGLFNTAGVEQAGYGLVNVGLFTNFQSFIYWSGTEYAPNIGFAWVFGTVNGYQDYFNKNLSMYALAVRPGQVAAVPVPAAAWLLGSGLLGLIGVARRKAA